MSEQITQSTDVFSQYQDEVAEIDTRLESFDLSEEERAELLDEREGVRLHAGAYALMELKSNPLPPIDDVLASKYLRPSARAELSKRLTDQNDPDYQKLTVINSVIEQDKGFRLVADRYDDREPGSRHTWMDVATGISPKS